MASGAFLFASARAGSQTQDSLREAGAALSPRGAVVPLFNGKDLSGLYVWLKDSKFEDPRRVFTVEDGLLRISGEVDGYLATRQAHKDYHLVVRKFELHPLKSGAF
jgi:hypothetical protein